MNNFNIGSRMTADKLGVRSNDKRVIIIIKS